MQKSSNKKNANGTIMQNNAADIEIGIRHIAGIVNNELQTCRLKYFHAFFS